MIQLASACMLRTTLQWARLLTLWLCSFATSATLGQTGMPELVPTPKYRILEISMEIYAQGLQRPEEAKGTIESTYYSWEWWNGMDGALKQLLHCPAEAGKFTYADFQPTTPPSNYSKNTGVLPIVAHRIRCSALRGDPPWQTCIAWDCGTVWPNWYNMSASCPSGWIFQPTSGAPQCSCPDGTDLRRTAAGWECVARCTPTPQRPWCETRDDSCPAGNPVLPATAVKVHTEVDYTGAGADALEFRRSFRSSGTTPYIEPGGWSHWVHNWGRRIEVFPNPDRAGRAWMIREDASQRIYITNGSATWAPWQLGDRNQLTEQRDANGRRLGFQYRVWVDDSVEHYDPQGKLLKVVRRNGWTTTLRYSTSETPVAVAPRPGLLISVRNQFGRELRLNYDSGGRLTELLPPGTQSGVPSGFSNSPIRYTHNEASSLGSGVIQADQLTSVTWQDGTKRRYHYEQSGQSGLLTGITDELGVRIGSYSYTADGRATRSEGPAGSNVVDIVHSGDRTDVIDRSSGSPVTSTYQWQRVQGAMRPVSVSAPCPLCGSTQASTAYTPNGEVARSIGHDGRISFFSYDSKGRETERALFASAYNTATSRPALSVAERVVTTNWHATWNLPLQRSEPGVMQWWNYDSSGRLLSDLRQATTDSNGATGLSASGTGSVTGRSLTYGATGLVTSSAEVLGFVVTGRWKYAYNALGDPTRMSGTQGGLASAADLASDAHGQLTRIAGDNGALATFAYTARGKLDRAQLPDLSFNVTRDVRSLPTRIDTSAGTWLRVEYDATGVPTQVIDNTGTVTPVLGMGGRDEPAPAAVDRARSQRLGRHAWLDRLPLSAAQAQPVTVLSQIIGRGLSSALPASQQRPMDPLEAPGCCSGGQRSPSFQFGSDFEKSMAPPLLVFSVATSLIELSANDTLIWASAYRLRKNMACAGITKPDAGCCHAHHIVHRNGYDKVAVSQSQAILAAVGINIDDAENGVYVDCTKHKDTQNGDYDRMVRDRLVAIPAASRTKSSVGAVLRGIALPLAGGC